MAGGIAVVVQQFGNSCSTIKTEIAHPPLKTSRMSTCHESDPTGLAGHSSCIVASEPSPFFREAVNVGCFCIWMPVASEVTIAQVIGKDENNIRFFLRKHTGKNDYKEEKFRKKGFHYIFMY
jgi:hypothetical protein